MSSAVSLTYCSVQVSTEVRPQHSCLAPIGVEER